MTGCQIAAALAPPQSGLRASAARWRGLFPHPAGIIQQTANRPPIIKPSSTTPTTSTHLHPRLDRLTQTAALALAVVMTLAALAQVGIALAAGLPLFLATALLTLGLVPIALIPTTIAPTVTVSDEGLTIAPLFWRRQSVPWAAVGALKPNPLLPPANTETGRRLISGRRHYEPARGVIVVLPNLPPQYRIVGFFAGEGFTSVITLGSRTHTAYDTLLASIERQLRQAEAG